MQSRSFSIAFAVSTVTLSGCAGLLSAVQVATDIRTTTPIPTESPATTAQNANLGPTASPVVQSPVPSPSPSPIPLKFPIITRNPQYYSTNIPSGAIDTILASVVIFTRGTHVPIGGFDWRLNLTSNVQVRNLKQFAETQQGTKQDIKQIGLTMTMLTGDGHAQFGYDSIPLLDVATTSTVVVTLKGDVMLIGTATGSIGADLENVAGDGVAIASGSATAPVVKGLIHQVVPVQ